MSDEGKRERPLIVLYYFAIFNRPNIYVHLYFNMYACMYIDGWKYKVATNECFALLCFDCAMVCVCVCAWDIICVCMMMMTTTTATTATTTFESEKKADFFVITSFALNFWFRTIGCNISSTHIYRKTISKNIANMLKTLVIVKKVLEKIQCTIWICCGRNI